MSPSPPIRLVDRAPRVTAEDLIAGLVPPPLFRDVRFDTFRPDPAELTQAAALQTLQEFAAPIGAAARKSGFLRRREPTHGPRGVYLDGGFGVGKTHLLASLWHAVPGPKAYATFVELTQLAGALGFATVLEALSGMRLLAIDEFELDDPGDTVLVSTLLGRLAERGVALAVTSNTLPDRLGEGRFAADDFVREIQGLAARFATVRVDGPDYRHRGLPAAPQPSPEREVIVRAARTAHSSLDEFGALCEHLASLHPSRYGALVDGVSAVHLTGTQTVTDQNTALRLVVFADRLYDRQVALLVSGVAPERLFDETMLAGGYRKKYRRAISRLVALNRIGAGNG